MKSRKRIQRDIEQHVAVDEEGVLARRPERRKAAGGAERFALDQHVESNPERAGLFGERTDEPLAEMAGEHGEAGNALAMQGPQLPENDRYASHRQQSFRNLIVRVIARARVPKPPAMITARMRTDQNPLASIRCVANRTASVE